ncbi:hypothetical protein SMSK23_0062 [Streptococcus oralis ATCC 35037]|nr:hypothetical protein SMSK23_0062 [Streptococcus oralis ATCC 35037]
MIIIKILENEDSSMANPTFGEKKENVTYQHRYGVYAVIPDPEKNKSF